MTKVYSSDSRSRGNKGFTQVEPLLTPKQLKARYLHGVTAKDGSGKDISEDIVQDYINIAVSMLEHDLDIFVMPREIVEQKDYRANDYYNWGYLMLNCRPAISVNSIEMAYLRSESNGQIVEDVIQELPKEWFRFDGAAGQIQFLPSNKFPSRLQIGGAGTFFPEILKRSGHIPDLWIVKYTAGFEDGCLPVMINHAIGLIAAMQYLNIAGDLIIGAGIAGTSISLDGFSQSIQTTSSAENHGYSAKLKEYQNLLFGKHVGDQSSILTILRNYYRGASINIV